MGKHSTRISFLAVMAICLMLLLNNYAVSQEPPKERLRQAIEYVDMESWGTAIETLEDVLLSLSGATRRSQ